MKYVLFLFAIFAIAKPPVLDALWPAGAARGSTIEVQAVGKQERWPVGVWCDSPGVTAFALADKGKLEIRIAANATLGPCLLRLHNADGASPLRSFVISDSAESAEVEPNNSLRTPHVLDSLPMVVNGRLGKSGDSDFFGLDLKAGDRLVARLDAYSLGSPIDPFLHLYDADGAEIAFASDSHNRDPLLVYRVEKAGRYLLQVVAIDHKASVQVRFSGAEKSVYRLRLELSDWQRYRKPPGERVGRLQTPGAEGEHALTVKKGDRLLIQVQAAALRLPMDPVLRVLAPDGKLVKEIDDSNQLPDPEYLLVAAVDGDYKAIVRDRFGRGGADFWYRLAAAAPVPSCAIHATVDQLTVKAGESADIKLKVSRMHGHDRKVSVAAARLPYGLSLEVPEVPAKTGEMTLTLKAAADAAAGSSELRLVMGDGESKEPIPFSFQNDESRGDFLVNSCNAMWITVLPK